MASSSMGIRVARLLSPGVIFLIMLQKQQDDKRYSAIRTSSLIKSTPSPVIIKVTKTTRPPSISAVIR